VSPKRVVVARTSFVSAKTEELANTRPEIVAGAVRQGTRFWSDDPIVRATPDLFVDESVIPGPSNTDTRSTDRPRGSEWLATVAAYRACRALSPDDLPTQEVVARKRGMSEDTLARRLRKLEIAVWHDVHALVETEPETQP
jgi:hypothetical protein